MSLCVWRGQPYRGTPLESAGLRLSNLEKPELGFGQGSSASGGTGATLGLPPSPFHLATITVLLLQSKMVSWVQLG